MIRRCSIKHACPKRYKLIAKSIKRKPGQGAGRRMDIGALFDFYPASLDAPDDLEFSRSTTGTLTDFEGLIKTAKINEMRMNGFRRVENLIGYSEDFSEWSIQAGTTVTTNQAIAPNGEMTADLVVGDGTSGIFTMPAVTVYTSVISVYMRSVVGTETVVLKDPYTATSTTTCNLTEEWQRFTLTDSTPGLTNEGLWIDNISASGIYVWGAQLEDVEGKTNQNPSEYVSSDVEAGSVILYGDSEFSGIGGTGEGIAPYGWSIYGNAPITYYNSHESFRYISNVHLSGININRAVYSQDIEANFEYEVRARRVSAQVSDEVLTVYDGDWHTILDNTATTGEFYVKTFTSVTKNSSLVLSRSHGGAAEVEYEIDYIRIREIKHNSNVDSVKYFNTENGNTVTGNVVNEGTGELIVTDVEQGLINEPQVTNIINYSEEFSSASWTKSGVTVTDNQTTAPNGKVVADELVVTSTGSSYLYNGSVTQACTFSIYVKYVDLQYMQLIGTGDADHYANFDIQNGIVGNVGPEATASIEDIGNGWYRLSVTLRTGTFSGSARAYRINSLTAGSAASTGDAGSYFVWGAMLENNIHTSTYIPTEATSVARNADILSVDNTDRKTLPNSFAYVIDFAPLANGSDVAAGSRLLGSVDSRGNSNSVWDYSATGWNYVASAGAGYFLTNGDELPKDTRSIIAFQLEQNGVNVDWSVHKDGLLSGENTVTQTLDHSNQQLNIGHKGGIQQFPMVLKQVRAFNPLSDDKLSEYTLLSNTVYHNEEIVTHDGEVVTYD